MKGLYHHILKKLSHFQVERPYLSLLIILTLTIAIVGGVSQVRTVASLEQMMPPEVEEIKAFNTLRDNHMGQDMIAVVLEVDRQSSDPGGVFDMTDERVKDYVSHIDELISSEPDVIGTHSMLDARNEEQLSRYLSHDRSKTILLATTDVSADDPRMNLLSRKIKKDVESAGTPPGVKVKFTGTPIIQQRLGELIAQDRSNTQWISTLMVFIITMLIFGTITSAIVPILVVTVSVNWLYGTMGYTNLPISTLAGGVAAMVIGIGIDFAIHIMNKFRYERKKGYTVRHAAEMAVVDTGTALTATSITTISAFLAFLIGVMPEMGRFGVLMAIGIGYSLVFSLFGLPALLVVEERLIYWLKKRLKFGVEGELRLATDKEKCEK
ncbi:MAG: MMPL family transporter [Nanobdellota archaeon]